MVMSTFKFSSLHLDCISALLRMQLLIMMESKGSGETT